MPGELATALAGTLAGEPGNRLGQAVDRLIASYRGAVPTDRPLLRDHTDVVAYAAYRMPATYAAVRSALGEFALLAPGVRPATQLDIGGGTGAAAWAAADVWPDLASITVLDWADPALELGRKLAASSPVLGARAEWRTQTAGNGPDLPEADLVTLSYVLGEVTGDDRREIVGRAAGRGRIVAVVEPGTPAGFGRIREARDLLVAAGLSVAAPCPHSVECPLAAGDDWCHFAVRLGRTALHRRVKGGSLGYEDEKYSYVVAVRGPVAPAGGRVLRHPLKRKGMVELTVCATGGGTDLRAGPRTRAGAGTGPGAGEGAGAEAGADSGVGGAGTGGSGGGGGTGGSGGDGGTGVTREIVTKKRHGEQYKQARDTAWGDAWPPVAADRPAGDREGVPPRRTNE